MEKEDKIVIENHSMIVAESDYLPLLFRMKNDHPSLDVKIVERRDFLNRIGRRYSKDPLPFLLKEGGKIKEGMQEYDKAKQWAAYILTSDITVNPTVHELYEILNDKGYITEDKVGLLSVKNHHLYLFEMDEDHEVKSLSRRRGLEFKTLHLSDLDLPSKEVEKNVPAVYYFPNKLYQYFYIFADIRKKLNENKAYKADDIAIHAESGDADFYSVRLASRIFNIPVLFRLRSPLSIEVKVQNKMAEIYKTGDYSFNEEELQDSGLKALADIVENYKLDEIEDKLMAYTDLLEIASSQQVLTNQSRRGVTLTDSFAFVPGRKNYITDFNYESFYKHYADKTVLDDEELWKIGQNPSYCRTALDRRKKLNYLNYTQYDFLSRVEQHLADKIYDSDFIKELDWDKITENHTITKITELQNGIYTSAAVKLLLGTLTDKGIIKQNKNVMYDHSYHQVVGHLSNKPTWSATSIESYISCPFAFYMGQLLPSKNQDYSARDIGTITHSVMEEFYHPNYNFEKAFTKAEKNLESVAAQRETPLTKADYFNLEIYHYWLNLSIQTLAKEKLNLSWAGPLKDYEVKVEFNISNPDNPNELARFSGKIDKLLVTEGKEDYFYTIIDYKTGKERFDPMVVTYGKSIQLPLYYLAVSNDPELVKPVRNNKKGMVFGGFFIQPMNSVSLYRSFKESNGNISEHGYFLNSRMVGLAKENDEYFTSLDKDVSYDSKGKPKSEYFDVKYKYPSEEESVLSDKYRSYPFNSMIEDTLRGTFNVIHKIQHNEFPIAPTSPTDLQTFRIDALTCSHCPYGDICYKNKAKDAKDYSAEIRRRFQNTKSSE